MTENIPICPECGKPMLPFVNIDTREVVYTCIPCSSPCRGCPKEKTCDDTYGPDCTYERSYKK
jgi:hypothetical protein